MSIMTKYIIPICTSIFAGTMLSYAQQLYRDQQNADLAAAQRDEEAQPMSKDDPNLMAKFDDDAGDEDSHLRDFDAEAAAIVNALCDKKWNTCVRSEDGTALNVTFPSPDGNSQEQAFTCSADCIARQLRQGAEHPDEDYGENEDRRPYHSYHGGDGAEISKEEYERLAELEQKHEREGTLHLLYPEIYDENYREWYDKLAEDGDEEE